MRKTFVITLLLILSLAFCFADSEDQGTQPLTNLTVLAVKSGSLVSDYALMVTASVPQSIVQEGQPVIGEVGTVESFDITKAINSSKSKNTIENALALKVATNSKKPVLVDVWFSAFRDTSRYKGSEQTTYDGVSAYYLRVKWIAKSADPALKAADEPYENNSYQYMLKLKINDKQMETQKDEVSLISSNEAGQTMHLVFTPVAEGGSAGDTRIPESSAPVLPGMDTDLNPLTLIDRTVNFTLNLPDSNEFSLIPANTNYTCTARITILGE